MMAHRLHKRMFVLGALIGCFLLFAPLPAPAGQAGTLKASPKLITPGVKPPPPKQPSVKMPAVQLPAVQSPGAAKAAVPNPQSKAGMWMLKTPPPSLPGGKGSVPPVGGAGLPAPKQPKSFFDIPKGPGSAESLPVPVPSPSQQGAGPTQFKPSVKLNPQPEPPSFPAGKGVGATQFKPSVKLNPQPEPPSAPTDKGAETTQFKPSAKLNPQPEPPSAPASAVKPDDNK